MAVKEIYEAFRKALLEVLIPEIKNLQIGQEKLRAELRQEIVELRQEMIGLRSELKEEMSSLRTELKEDMAGLRHTQEMILEKLDLGNRVTKLETLIEQLQKRVA